VVEAHEPYFVQKRDGLRSLSLSSLKKMTVALWMLAYSVTNDFIDDYTRIGESITIKSLQKLVKVVVSIFFVFEEYFRSPNNNNIARLP
jgi:hypothetical protein